MLQTTFTKTAGIKKAPGGGRIVQGCRWYFEFGALNLMVPILVVKSVFYVHPLHPNNRPSGLIGLHASRSSIQYGVYHYLDINL
jgi:hypothetical protein